MGTFLFIAAALLIAYISISTKVNSKNKRGSSKINLTPERPLPKSKAAKPFVPKREEIEIKLPGGAEKIKLNSLAQIKYSDAKGQISVRRITIKSIGKAYGGDLYIDSFCHECKEERTFKLSRIENLVDIETGEIYSNASKYFTDRFEATPVAEITKELEKLQEELLVLAYMSRADGYMRKKEREVIAEYIIKRSCKPLLNREILDNEIRLTYCEAPRFRAALDKLKGLPVENKEWIYKTAAAIVATEKKVDIVETGILEFIREALEVEKTVIAA